LRGSNPSLIIGRLDAYGWTGPWAARRGFDSLVQMSTSIAFLDADSPPSPLPVQALDHATGYLLAAAVCRALTGLVFTGVPTDIRTSLVATANQLLDLPTPTARAGDLSWPAEVFEAVATEWGPAQQVRVPGRIEGIEPSYAVPAGSLGRHEPSFS
jgi:crotonobetainyl-CoA:carnitine CoA-transferase CaiB-like acyl-CoA transferase